MTKLAEYAELLKTDFGIDTSSVDAFYKTAQAAGVSGKWEATKSDDPETAARQRPFVRALLHALRRTDEQAATARANEIDNLSKRWTAPAMGVDDSIAALEEGRIKSWSPRDSLRSPLKAGLLRGLGFGTAGAALGGILGAYADPTDARRGALGLATVFGVPAALIGGGSAGLAQHEDNARIKSILMRRGTDLTVRGTGKSAQALSLDDAMGLINATGAKHVSTLTPEDLQRTGLSRSDLNEVLEAASQQAQQLLQRQQTPKPKSYVSAIVDRRTPDFEGQRAGEAAAACCATPLTQLPAAPKTAPVSAQSTGRPSYMKYAIPVAALGAAGVALYALAQNRKARQKKEPQKAAAAPKPAGEEQSEDASAPLTTGVEKVLGEGAAKALKGLAGKQREMVETPVIDTIQIAAQGPRAQHFVRRNSATLRKIVSTLSSSGRL